MPINWLNFLQQPVQSSGLGDILPSAIQGYQAAKLPAEMKRKAKMDESKIALNEALAESERLYGGLGKLSGPAAQVASIHRLEKALGYDHPIVQQARKAFELDQAHTQETMDSSRFYRENPQRLYDPTTKAIHAQQQLAQGAFPDKASIDAARAGNPALTPEQAQQAIDVHAGKQIKESVPQPILLQKVAANQIEATFKQIDKKALFQYNGPKGRAQLGKDLALEAAGKAPESFRRFKEQLTKIHGLQPQLTAYYSGSVSPTAQAALDRLINPQSWLTSPETAMKQLDSFEELMKAEIGETNKALRGVGAYDQAPIFQAGPNSQEIAESVNSRQTQAPGGSSAVFRIMNPKTGKIHSVPANMPDKIQAMLNEGGVQVP